MGRKVSEPQAKSEVLRKSKAALRRANDEPCVNLVIASVRSTDMYIVDVWIIVIFFVQDLILCHGKRQEVTTLNSTRSWMYW